MNRWFLSRAGLVVVLLGGAFWAFQSTHPAVDQPIRDTAAAPQNPPVDGSGQAVSTPALSSPSPSAGPSQTPSYTYNALGEITLIRYPDGSTYTCAYDAHGDKIRERDRNKNTWSYVYDQQQHPVTIIGPNGRVTPP